MISQRRLRGFLCKDCSFLDYTGEIDQCPYCRSDDWRRVDIEKCKSCQQWVRKKTCKEGEKDI